MDYQINFSTATVPSRVKESVVRRWGLDLDAIYAGPEIDWATYEGPQLLIVVETGIRPGSDFDTQFSAGEAFAEVCGRLSELRLTTDLCRELGARALIPDGGSAPNCWMLVTEDGWHGRVILDDDAADEHDAMVIDHAYQPVPAAPELRVQDPPEWQAGWYADGTVPESGYLESRAQ